MDIVEFPNKIIYYAEQDKNLDLRGGKVKLTTREGKDYYFDMTETEFDIIHSVNFNVEGVYVVELRRTSKLSYKFPIVVISSESVGE